MDLYRVNFEVNNLKPFLHLAFPHSRYPKRGLKTPSFGGEIDGKFCFAPGSWFQIIPVHIWPTLKIK